MPKTFLTSYFGFNKQQRNGIYVLLSLSLSLLLIRLLYPYFIQPDTIQILNLPLAERRLDSATKHSSHFVKDPTEKDSRATTVFVFNPNIASKEELLQLGFSEKTAKNLVRFRQKGFVFREKKDLLKVYGVSAELYSILEAYIVIPTKSIQEFKPKPNSPKKLENPILQKSDHKIELNSADSAELVAVKGIGASYANRILKYRILLGGYVSILQLKEVYGLQESTFLQIKDHLTLNINLVQKLNLNTDEFKKINKHPYISYELCKSLFDWRKKTKLNATNLKSILNDEALYTKLLPYLTFD